MLITIFCIAVIAMMILVGFNVYSISLYKKALAINPKKKTLENLENEIAISQTTIEGYKEQLKLLEIEKNNALDIIKRKDAATEFLANHAEELARKRQDIKNVEDELDTIAEKMREASEELQEKNNERNNIANEIINKEVQLKGLNAEINLKTTEIGSLDNKIEKLKSDISRLEEDRNLLDAQVKNLEEKLKSLKEKEEEYYRIVKERNEAAKQLSDIRSEITGAIIQSGETKKAQEVVEAKRWEDLDRPYINYNKEEGKNVEEIQWLSDFKDNLASSNVLFSERTINAFHTGLKVADYSPLVVLAGISGTGKSLLPQLYAKASGMNFLSVAVQPRWDSPQDMFGFYNYMQNKFKATELSRLLWQYDFYNNPEVKKKYTSFGKLPMNLVLLDEMNLARVEYYFSDMLSKLEVRRTVSVEDEISRRVAEVEIESGSISSKDLSRRLFVSRNNLFIGTMNEDETTQSLSDKVVDRSNVLRFGKPKDLQSKANISLFEDNYRNVGYMSYSNWSNLNLGKGLSSEYEKKLYHIIKEINETLASVDRPFAHRVWSSIENYVNAYPDVMTGNNFNHAIADQIEMKILPKLNGLEKDNPKVAQALSAISSQLETIKDAELQNAFELVKDDTSNVFFAWKGVTREVESK